MILALFIVLYVVFLVWYVRAKERKDTERNCFEMELMSYFLTFQKYHKGNYERIINWLNAHETT